LYQIWTVIPHFSPVFYFSRMRRSCYLCYSLVTRAQYASFSAEAVECSEKENTMEQTSMHSNVRSTRCSFCELKQLIKLSEPSTVACTYWSQHLEGWGRRIMSFNSSIFISLRLCILGCIAKPCFKKKETWYASVCGHLK
jgi:hypothetical protein